VVTVLADRPLEPIARRYALDFIALFGSTAREGAGRDVDLAVMPREKVRAFTARIELYQDLSEVFAPAVVDLSILADSSWLLSWQVARDGRALLGEDGFARFRETAYWRRQDSHCGVKPSGGISRIFSREK
jgi:predicted nucleotidyltransferase